MGDSSDRFSKLAGCLLMMTGTLFYLVYLVFLPLQEVFYNDEVRDPGLLLYSLATAGAGFVAWGWMLISVDSASSGQVSHFRRRIWQASALGFLMLGLMRVGTALFPHAPFQSMLVLPVSECVIFLLLAFVLLRKAKISNGAKLQPAQ